MERPCGGCECRGYVETHGGDPDCPSDWMCAGCGAEGPMNWFYTQCTESSDDGDNEE